MEGGHAGAVYNVGGGVEVSMLQAIEVLAQVSGRRLDVVHGRRVEGDVSRTAADTSRIRAELGWEPRTSFEQGLEAQWRWAADRVATP
jgi:nucleoside-diphosphate-sugar epimerase